MYLVKKWDYFENFTLLSNLHTQYLPLYSLMNPLLFCLKNDLVSLRVSCMATWPKMLVNMRRISQGRN